MHKLINITAIILLILSSCRQHNNQSATDTPIKFNKQTTGYIIKTVTKDTITIELELAQTDYEIQTGLMYRHDMKPNQGMLFIFNESQPRSFYMKNTYLPLDIIYLNDNQQIDSFVENTTPLDPTPLPSKGDVKYVLEINAGLAEKWGLDLGDQLIWD